MFGWPASSMFYQPDLEQLLAEAVSGQPTITVRPGYEVTDVRPDGEGANVRAAGPGGTGADVRAQWVIGCDGAEQPRPVAGGPGCPRPELPGSVADRRRLTGRAGPLVAAEYPGLRSGPADHGGVRGVRGRRRFEFMRLPSDRDDDFGTAASAWRLLEPWGLTPANAALERHATYTFAARLVGEWRRGRVLVAGDAAHQMPPFACEGLRSGLRDAASRPGLAAPLRAPARQAPETLLDSYGAERGPQVRAEIDFSVELGKIICVLDPAEAAARDENFLPIGEAGPVPVPDRPPLGAEGLLLPGDPHAGKLALQAPVGMDGQAHRLDDVTSGSWVLLGQSADPAATLPAGLAHWWATLGGRSFQVTAGGPVDDRTGAYGRWFGSLEREIVLIRPDAYIFGTATAPDGAVGLTEALRAALTGSPWPR